jgi:integrase
MCLHPLRSKLGWVSRSDYPAPRIHDLRHSFICHRVLLWYQQGVNVDNAMAMLSTYVGHAKVTDTYWYLTGTPELMTIAAQRFERFAQGADHG